MKKFIALSILFLLAGVLLWWSGRPTVAVVRSLDELRQQPPIQLPGGVTIRLGISGSESYVGGGQLLYCLATGLRGEMNEEEGRLRLGPVIYKVVRPGDIVKPTGSEVFNPWRWGKRKERPEGFSAWTYVELQPTD